MTGPTSTPHAGAVIEIEGLWKRFRAPGQAPRTLKDWLLGRLRPRPATPEFWALQDVALSVQAGEAIGLVGDNGSGKSTLLKLIAGILAPNRGRVAVTGRISALLELGAGFHPEFSGRENVYLNAAILGLARAETDARFNEIVAFADIGAFLDAPVKTYSSGMYMRLAFAIAVCVDPDILIIDEVLAVGDASFQRKCFARIRRFREAGKTIVLVSHDAAAVRAICDRALWLEKGQVMALGEAGAVLERYAARDVGVPAAAGGRAFPIRELAFAGRFVHAPGIWLAGQAFTLRFELGAGPEPAGLDLVLKIVKSDGVTCYTSRQPLNEAPAEARVEVLIPELPLLSGEYLLEIAVAEGPLYLEVRRQPFRVHCDVAGEGVAPLACTWTLAAHPADLAAKPASP